MRDREPGQYLGRRVRVTLNHGGHPDPGSPAVIAEGVLLAFGEGGDLQLLCDDGFVHHCWPMLDVEGS